MLQFMTIIAVAGASFVVPASSQWMEVNYDPSAPHLWDLVFVDDFTGYAAGANSIMKTQDGGLTWRTIDLPEVAEDERRANIYFYPSGKGLMARNDLGLWVSENEGETWEPLNREIKGISRRLTGGSYLTNNEFWKSTDGGLNWHQLPLELPEDRTEPRKVGTGEAIACCFNNSFTDAYWITYKFGIVVGGFSWELKAHVERLYGALVYITYDGGWTWTQDILEGGIGGPSTFLGIFSSHNLLWMVGMNENVWSGNPGFWEARGKVPGFIMDYNGVFKDWPYSNSWFSTGVSLDEQRVWVAGARIAYSTGGGETWTVEYGKDTPDFRQGWITKMARAGNRIVGVGKYSQILIRNIEDTPTGVSPISWGQVKQLRDAQLLHAD